MNTTSRGSLRSLSTSSDVIVCSAPSIDGWARLGAGRNHDMPGLDRRLPDADRVGSDEGGMSADDLDATFGKRQRDRLGDGADQLLFAVDQRRPVELWLAQFDAMDLGPRDLIQ